MLEAIFQDSPNIQSEFLENVFQKRFKYHRREQKWIETQLIRQKLGLPVETELRR